MSADWLDDLNDEQRQAVELTEGAVRLIAGAGTGKTRALTYRFAYLLLYLGISPRSILALTFTNKAAGEMKSRIASLTSGDLSCNITTFHGFAANFLKTYAPRLSFAGNFNILDSTDQKDILISIYDELKINGRELPLREMIDYIGVKKSPTDYIDILANKNAVDIVATAYSIEDIKLKIFYLYLARQKITVSLDFDDLINFMLCILLQDKDLAQSTSKSYEYIMVDEFQDVDGKQFALLKILSEVNGNIFVVGDPDQNIYSFRGSDPHYIINMDREFKNVRTLYLLKNYRTQSCILDAAFSLISHNKLDLRKKLMAMRDDVYEDDMVDTQESFIEELNTRNDENSIFKRHAINPELLEDKACAARSTDVRTLKPIFASVASERQEALYIANSIDKVLRHNPGSTVAVLIRARMQIRSIERALIEKGIAYAISSGVKFTQRKEIRDVIAYLRLMLNHDDDSAFLRVVNSPRRGFGKSRVERLKALSLKNRISLFKTLKAVADNTIDTDFKDIKLITGPVKAFIEMADRCNNISEMGAAAALESILSLSEYENTLRKQGDNDRLESLAMLRHLVLEYAENQHESVNIADFIGSLMLRSPADEAGATNVEIMTAHNAKGLEFDYVYIAGLNEGLFPSRKALNPESIEEERRLLYVAMTRAKKQLFMTNPGGSFENSDKRIASRFISDIKNDCLYRIGLKIQAGKEQSHAIMPRSKVFSQGDFVMSNVLGRGRVENVNAKDCEYVIYFERLGRSRTLSFHAPLERIDTDE